MFQECLKPILNLFYKSFQCKGAILAKRSNLKPAGKFSRNAEEFSYLRIFSTRFIILETRCFTIRGSLFCTVRSSAWL